MTYASTVLADSPSAYWRLGEASGVNAADATGNGKTGTYENAPTLGVTGLLTGDSDTAVTLNGTTQDILVPTDIASLATSTSALSIEGWIKTSTAAGTLFGCRKSTSGNPIIRLYTASGLLSFQVRDNSGVGLTNVSSDVIVNDNVRHYVVATRDTSKVWRLYVDGVLALVQADTMANACNGLDWTYIGRERSAAQFFTGTVDEFATYIGVTLTQTQINDHYTAGSQEATTGLSDFFSGVILGDTPGSYWRLGESSGIRAADSSGNANHGARRNGAPVGSAGLIADSADTAVTLDGTNDRIDTPATTPLATTTTAWSFEAWVKTTSATTQHIWAGRRWNNNNPILDVQVLSTGVVRLLMRGDGSSGTVANFDGTVNVADGHPHYIAITIDTSKNVRIYVDGALDTGPTAHTLAQGITNLDKQSIGVDRTVVTSFFNGTVDEIAFYAATLTSTQITNHWNAARQASLPFIGSVTAVYGPTLPVSVPFIASTTVVHPPVLQANVTPSFIASTTVVYTPTLSAAQVDVPFISSVTVVYTPTVISAGVNPPFISSVTVVYTPVVTSIEVDPDFIDSVTIVYTPNLMATFTGGGVSQVALEVAAASTDGDAFVSQVTLEIVVPQYKDLHVWQRS